MTSKNDKKEIVTLDEAKKEVQNLVQQGVNFRDIAKKKFPIGDRIKKFSIGEISRLKNEVIKENNLNNIDEDTAFLFKEFNKRKDPIQLIIETKLKPDFVNDAYAEYQKLQDMKVVSSKFYNTVIESIDRVTRGQWGDLDEDVECIKDAVDYYLTPKDF